MSNAGESISINEVINNFVRKNRTLIFIILGILAAGLGGFIAVVSITDALRGRAIGRLEEFNRRYETLRFDIGEESKAAEVAELVGDLTAFAEKTSGYAGGRAWSIIGGIHADKKEWQEAERAFTSAAKAAAKTYLAPVAYFNAAVAAEEQGNITGAIDLYTRCVAQSAVFPAAVRAQFAIARLWENQGSREAALEAYRAVTSGWPNDTVWTNLAHSRIILLEAGGETIAAESPASEPEPAAEGQGSPPETAVEAELAAD
jgi:tetratricopeptide (TPR) repeat protein